MLKKTAAILFLLLSSIFLSIRSTEGIVRPVKLQQLNYCKSDIWAPGTLLGFKKLPLIEEIMNVGEGKVHVYTDENGHRINIPQNRPSGCDKSILMLGDSFLETFQVENEETYPEILRQMLIKKYHVEVCPVSTGVGRYNPNHYYLITKKELKRRKYDLVLVGFYIGNDFVTNFDAMMLTGKTVRKPSFWLPTSLRTDELKGALWYPFRFLLVSKSHLYILFRNIQDHYYHTTPNKYRIRRFFTDKNIHEFNANAFIAQSNPNISQSTPCASFVCADSSYLSGTSSGI